MLKMYVCVSTELQNTCGKIKLKGEMGNYGFNMALSVTDRTSR